MIDQLPPILDADWLMITHPELELELLGDWLSAWDMDLPLGRGEAGPVWCLQLVSGISMRLSDWSMSHIPRAPSHQAVVVAHAAAAPALLSRLVFVTLRASVSPLEVILIAGLETETQKKKNTR